MVPAKPRTNVTGDQQGHHWTEGDVLSRGWQEAPLDWELQCEAMQDSGSDHQVPLT